MRKWNNKNLTIQTKYYLLGGFSVVDTTHDKKTIIILLYNYNRNVHAYMAQILQRHTLTIIFFSVCYRNEEVHGKIKPDNTNKIPFTSSSFFSSFCTRQKKTVI